MGSLTAGVCRLPAKQVSVTDVAPLGAPEVLGPQEKSEKKWGHMGKQLWLRHKKVISSQSGDLCVPQDSEHTDTCIQRTLSSLAREQLRQQNKDPSSRQTKL